MLNDAKSNSMFRICRSFVITFALLLPLYANAGSYPPEPAAYKRLTIKYGLPDKLLYAIALNESQVQTNKRHATPWPWVVKAKADKRGRYYRTKSEAIAYAEQLLRQGTVNFDVGIAQVNYRWHGHKFKSLSQMLNPTSNLDYAASVVKGFHDGGDDWWTSTGRYHSPSNKRRAKSYSERVYKIYKEL